MSVELPTRRAVVRTTEQSAFVPLLESGIVARLGA